MALKERFLAFMEQKFREADTDNDGYITKEEWLTASMSNGVPEDVVRSTIEVRRAGSIHCHRTNPKRDLSSEVNGS